MQQEILRTAVWGVARVSPDLAAWALEPLMFRTRRRPAPAWEREALARGERGEVESPAGKLVTWSFGSGPVVLLVHGWNGRGGQLASLVSPLVSRGFRVVTFDAPGHGASPGQSASLLAFADATLAVLDAVRPVLAPARAVVAHSMGGAAVTYAMHQRLKEGLPAERFVFVAPPVDVRDFLRTFVRDIGGGATLERSLHARIESRFGLVLEDLYAPALARQIEAPLLIVHDADDREVPVDRGRLLASAWPGARFEQTRGLGHNRILADADVTERVVRFIDR